MDDIVIDIESLRRAFATLKEAYGVYKSEEYDEKYSDYILDSCVQRFEYTFETVWKTMKRYLKLYFHKPENDLSMNNIFRYMESYGFAKSWENWRDYYKERNNTSHEYDIEKSRELIKIIPDFIEDVEYFIKKFDEAKDD